MERACRKRLIRTKAFAVSGNDIGRRKRHKLIHIKSRRVDNILFYKKVMYLDDKRIRFIKPITAFCFLSANGESFSPYQTLSAGSLHIVDVENMHKDYKFLLHSNFPYLSVGISFKKEMIEEYLYSLKKEKNISYSDIFTSFNPAIIKSFAPLAKEILNCKMKSPAAELFFEANKF